MFICEPKPPLERCLGRVSHIVQSRKSISIEKITARAREYDLEDFGGPELRHFGGIARASTEGGEVNERCWRRSYTALPERKRKTGTRAREERTARRNLMTMQRLEMTKSRPSEMSLAFLLLSRP